MSNVNFKVKNGLDVNGNVTIAGTPTDNNHATTKSYVDTAVSTTSSSSSTALNTHIADETLHLTSAQDTWIDAISVSSAEVNRLAGVTSNIQTQLNDRELTANKGAINGYASLDSSGKVPASQLPSYVDDVLEYADSPSFPVIGELSKIYIALNDGKIYRWTGTVYAEISPTAGNADTATKLLTPRTIASTGDGSWSVSFDGSSDASSTLTLATTGVSAGSYGNGTTIPSFTVDDKGRITQVTPTAVSIPIGYTGSQGNIGYTGSASTIQGPIGYTGSAGYTGSQGSTGFTGSASTIQGPIGYTGSQGNIGYTGSGYGTSANVQMNSLGVGTASSGTAGDIRATGDITAYYSDDRLKTRLGDIVGAIEKVLQLDAFYYEANETAQQLGYTPKREVGLSAQQVSEVMPEVVAPAPVDERYLTLKYERLVPLLIAAIKEQQTQIEELKTLLVK